MARLRGVEPLTHGLEVRCSIQLSYRRILERVKGIGPSQPAWKAGALPLSYTRIFGGDERIRTTESIANGFTVRPIWPTLELPQDLYFIVTHYSINYIFIQFYITIKLELMIGLEPTTY